MKKGLTLEEIMSMYSDTLIDSRRKAGFTLAEVLITLGIIGVISAITISVIIPYFQERIAVNRVKNFYSKFTEAVKLFQVENDCIGETNKCFEGYDFHYNNIINGFQGIAKRLKIVDIRPSTGRVDWLPDDAYAIDGEKISNTDITSGYLAVFNGSPKSAVSYLLADGTTMTVHINNNGCGGSHIMFDINGKKKPNRIGQDQFPIGLAKGWPNWSTLNQQIADTSPYFSTCSNNKNWSDVGQFVGLCSVGWNNDCSPDDISSPTAYVLKNNKLPKPKDFGYSK